MTSSLQNPRWTRLSKKRQDELLEKHRYDAVDNDSDWSEGVQDAFRERCMDKGIEVDKIFYSGFASQGDGASFTGHIFNWDLFFDHIGEKDARLASIASARYDFNGWTFRLVSNDGRYCHENCVSSSTEFHTDNGIDPVKDPLRYHAYQLLLDELERNNGAPLGDKDAEYLEACRDLMRELYRKLEDEHDYRTDDERVVEDILACQDDDELADPDDEEEEEEEEEEGESWVGCIAPATLDSFEKVSHII